MNLSKKYKNHKTELYLNSKSYTSKEKTLKSHKNILKTEEDPTVEISLRQNENIFLKLVKEKNEYKLSKKLSKLINKDKIKDLLLYTNHKKNNSSKKLNMVLQNTNSIEKKSKKYNFLDKIEFGPLSYYELKEYKPYEKNLEIKNAINRNILISSKNFEITKCNIQKVMSKEVAKNMLKNYPKILNKSLYNTSNCKRKAYIKTSDSIDFMSNIHSKAKTERKIRNDKSDNLNNRVITYYNNLSKKDKLEAYYELEAYNRKLRIKLKKRNKEFNEMNHSITNFKKYELLSKVRHGSKTLKKDTNYKTLNNEIHNVFKKYNTIMDQNYSDKVFIEGTNTVNKKFTKFGKNAINYVVRDLNKFQNNLNSKLFKCCDNNKSNVIKKDNVDNELFDLLDCERNKKADDNAQSDFINANFHQVTNQIENHKNKLKMELGSLVNRLEDKLALDIAADLIDYEKDNGILQSMGKQLLKTKGEKTEKVKERIQNMKKGINKAKYLASLIEEEKVKYINKVDSFTKTLY